MFSRLSVLPCAAAVFISISVATNAATIPQNSAPKKSSKTKTEEVDEAAAQRRTVAISLITTLADEARAFKDQTRRARVQARAADVLWDSDPERARELFRRAWDAADAADAEALRLRTEEFKKQQGTGRPTVFRGGPDLRSEVLRIATNRDQKLGEEFLKAMEAEQEKQTADNGAELRQNAQSSLAATKRLQVARRLVEDGQIERALAFARPALDQVNIDSIFFLSTLREKNAQFADTAFASLLNRVSRDPQSDANTVSGLSSYLFTPFVYVTFEPSGGANQNRGGQSSAPAVDAALRISFLRVAYQILMQPSPAPDQDRTTAGIAGKYLVIKRLLPVFEEFAGDLAPGLRTQMTALASFVPPSLQQGENRALTVGLGKDVQEGDPYQRMQERLDRAKTSDDRDAIYADYAVSLTDRADSKARELIDKIENIELRKNVRAYTDFQITRQAITDKDATEAARMARTGDLTSIQKVWAFTSAARLVTNAERSHAIELLEEALTESRRIGNSDPDRARALTAVASGLAELDPVRTWETLAEVVKAANAADGFTGEDSRITTRLQTKFMTQVNNTSAEGFDLMSVFRPLARADLFRAVQMARGFTGEAPRAVATLAIARSVLESNRTQVAAGNAVN
jgi:hypothetical protein